MNRETLAPVFNVQNYESDSIFEDGLETKKPFKKGNESNYSVFPYDDFKKPGNKKDCMYEFNKPTYYVTQEGYKKRVQESEEPLKYKFDFKPSDPCLIRTQQFQGLSFASKRPPASLVDVEDYLKKSSLIIENNKAVAFDINKKSPSMPDILNNRFSIPECEKDYSFETTKTQRYELPQYNNPVYPKGHYQTNVMGSGRDTRQEIKDNYKKPSNKYNIPLPKSKMPSLPSLPAVEAAKDIGKITYYKERYPCKDSYKYHHCNNKACPTNVAFFNNNSKNKPQKYTEYNMTPSCNM